MPLTSSPLDGSPQDRGGKAHSSKADTQRASNQNRSTLQGLNANYGIYPAICLEGNYTLMGGEKIHSYS